MNSETPLNASYLSRCEAWLESDPALTSEGLNQTIEKFTRQLQSNIGGDTVVQQDLQDTIDLLNNHLVELLGPDAEEPEILREAPSSQSASASTESLLDLSPLLPLEQQAMNLSREEKQQRLADLLASGVVTQGLGK